MDIPGWGKPPKMQAPIDGEVPPKRGPAPKAAPRTSTRSLKSEISGMLMTINFMLVMIPPLREDRLDMVEIDALADAIDEECRQSIPFRRAVESALKAGSGGGLVGLVAIIGARRAIRHGVIPGGEEADQELGNLLAKGMAVKHGRDAAGVI